MNVYVNGYVNVYVIYALVPRNGYHVASSPPLTFPRCFSSHPLIRPVLLMLGLAAAL